MPIYEYRCRRCENVFEKIQKMDEGSDALRCPICGAPGPERVLSTFSSSKSSEPASSCGPSGGSSHFS